MISELFLFGLGIGMSTGGAVGVLAGRKLEFNNAYQAGKASAQVMNDYERQHPGRAVDILTPGRKPHPPITEHPHYCKPSCFA